MNVVSDWACENLLPILRLYTLGLPILKSAWKMREKGNRFALYWILKLTAILVIECLLSIKIVSISLNEP